MRRNMPIRIYLSAIALFLSGAFSEAHAKYFLKIPCELKPNGHYNIDQYQFERMTAPHTPKDEETRIRSFQKLGEEKETGHVVGVCHVEIKK